jgi:SAM-dependent methyltransferase
MMGGAMTEALRPWSVRLWTGDVNAIDSADATYDAVFDFGIIHHVPDWRGALREIHRVLRPGGTVYAEEVMRSFILHPLWSRLFEHPRRDRFDADGLARGLEDAGFSVRRRRGLLDDFAFFIADKPLSSHEP